MIDLSGSAMILRQGKARSWAVRRLRELGHDVQLRGGARVIALYTDPDNLRGALIRRLKSGRVGVTRYGTLKPREIVFLHSLESSLPA